MLSDSSESTQAERCWALEFVYIEITHPCFGTAHGLEEVRSLHTCLQKAGAVALALWPVDLPPHPRPQHSSLLNGALLPNASGAPLPSC